MDVLYRTTSTILKVLRGTYARPCDVVAGEWQSSTLILLTVS
jgi:hypothetical protein